MSFGLFPQEQNNALDAIQRMGPAGPPQPGFFSGIPTAVATGVGEGALKTAAPLVEESGVDMLGALSPSPDFYTAPAQPPVEHTQEEIDAHTRQAAQDGIEQFRPNPNITGFAGNILHSVASVGVRAVAGAELAGPIGAAVVAGGTEGYNTSESMQLRGVDKNLAHALGAADSLMTGVGVGTPFLSGVGKTLATRAVSGATINVLFGAADRAAMHTALAENGYDAMAKQYAVLDGQALASDAILGTFFGGIGHFHAAPSVVDAAHVAADAAHVEGAANGVPTDPISRNNHVDNMTAAARALMNDEPVADLKPVDTIPNPAQDALRAAAADAHMQAAAEAVAEAGMGAETPAFTGIERRSDMIESARLAELTNKHNTDSLTPAETTEWATLLNRDRLSTTVAGRRIQGVGSYAAYTEMLARGEGKPVVGFADADMLHATNEAHGYPVGDALIRTLGETLAHYFGEGNVFRRASDTGGSDEFITHANTEAEHTANMQKAQQYLENHTLRAYDKVTGEIIGEKKGAGFSHGKGTDEASAAANAKLDKQRRADAGLRSDRGTVAEKPGATGGKGGSAQAARPKTAVEAISKLTQALKRLVETDGKDAASHATARAIMGHTTDAGWSGIDRAAVDRAGPGADKALAAALVHEQPAGETGSLDPATRESVDQAQSVIDRRPDTVIPGADGVPVAGHDALNQALEGVAAAKQEGVLHQIAAACFGRG
jgi:GGDEF domain-containing protein